VHMEEEVEDMVVLEEEIGEKKRGRRMWLRLANLEVLVLWDLVPMWVDGVAMADEVEEEGAVDGVEEVGDTALGLGITSLLWHADNASPPLGLVM
jgi:hypothetical protein